MTEATDDVLGPLMRAVDAAMLAYRRADGWSQEYDAVIETARLLVAAERAEEAWEQHFCTADNNEECVYEAVMNNARERYMSGEV